MPSIFRDKVVCGTVTFNDASTKPSMALQFGLDTLDGWRRSPSLQVQSTAFGGAQDGEIPSGYWAANARHLMIGGWVTTTSRENAEEAEDLILGDAFPTNQDLVLVRYEAIPKYMRVRVEGEIEIQYVGPNNFRWQVPVQTVGSPFKFSYNLLANESGSSGVAGESSGGRVYPRTYPLTYITTSSGSENEVVLENHGTAPTDPIAVINGPLPEGGWRLENETTAEFIQFDVGLAATDVLTIDFAQKVALLNGYAVTTSINGDFWKVQRGLNVIKLYAEFDELAGFTISINSAWR